MLANSVQENGGGSDELVDTRIPGRSDFFDEWRECTQLDVSARKVFTTIFHTALSVHAYPRPL